jgi:hypothetical protein
MKIPIDISDRLYTIVNVASVTGTISGSVYKGSKPESIAQLQSTQNILIVPLGSLNTSVQQHICNVNIYVPDFSDGTADEDKMKTIATTVIAVIEAYDCKGEYFVFEKNGISTRIIRDDNNMSFLNIRIPVLTD